MTTKDSGRSGVWKKSTIFLFRKLDEDGTGTDFETSYAKTDTPVKLLDTDRYPAKIHQGIIMRLHYRINPTNAETYTLRLYMGAVAGNYESNMKMIYESPALQVADEDYDREVLVPYVLSTRNKMYFALEWTGTAGTTTGFIDVSGELIK